MVDDIFNANVQNDDYFPMETTENIATVKEDKIEDIRKRIEKIPKPALFDYKIEWDLLDNELMENRIRPWISKKITGFIGEPEPELTDYICSKVLEGSAPQTIVEDVQVVLDEDAQEQVFR